MVPGVTFNKAPALCDVSAVHLLQGLQTTALYGVSALPDDWQPERTLSDEVRGGSPLHRLGSCVKGHG